MEPFRPVPSDLSAKITVMMGPICDGNAHDGRDLGLHPIVDHRWPQLHSHDQANDKAGESDQGQGFIPNDITLPEKFGNFIPGPEPLIEKPAGKDGNPAGFVQEFFQCGVGGHEISYSKIGFYDENTVAGDQTME
jgi:hypothetical protein